jgi:hypothetical protein
VLVASLAIAVYQNWTHLDSGLVISGYLQEVLVHYFVCMFSGLYTTVH